MYGLERCFAARIWQRRLQERPRLPQSPAPPSARECKSFAALERAVIDETTCKADRKASTFRLVEKVERGESVPYAALAHRFIPDTKHHAVDVYKSRVYGGRFVGAEGNRFVTTCQDENIRVYDTGLSEKRQGWKLTHNIPCEHVIWTVTDFDVSPDGRWLAYSTINQYVHVVDMANPDNPQRIINFCREYSERAFGIMSVVWSHDGSELIIGTSSSRRRRDGHVIAYDTIAQRIVDKVRAHDEDVNSVCFLKDTERNLLLTGSDDALGKC